MGFFLLNVCKHTYRLAHVTMSTHIPSRGVWNFGILSQYHSQLTYRNIHTCIHTHAKNTHAHINMPARTHTHTHTPQSLHVRAVSVKRQITSPFLNTHRGGGQEYHKLGLFVDPQEVHLPCPLIGHPTSQWQRGMMKTVTFSLRFYSPYF